MAQRGILWLRVAFCGTEWHAVAQSGTLPGERRRGGWKQEQVAVAGRPTGQPQWRKAALQLSTRVLLSGFPKLLEIEGSQKPLWQKERKEGCM